MANTVDYIKSGIRPAVESLHGSMGMSLFANTEVGVWYSSHSGRRARH